MPENSTAGLSHTLEVIHMLRRNEFTTLENRSPLSADDSADEICRCRLLAREQSVLRDLTNVSPGPGPGAHVNLLR
jgi:hypothetical protein